MKKGRSFLQGLQWFFFIFANIVIIPITIGEAFKLDDSTVIFMMQMSFIVTGLVSLLQVYFGHGRPLLEGQSGLWWGVFLSLVAIASSQGLSLVTLGGSIAVGVFISGVITILIALFKLGHLFSRLFTPAVMGVFMMLLGVTLIQIFTKGMLGLSFTDSTSEIDLPILLLSIFLVLMVSVINIKAKAAYKSYGLLVGILIGWLVYVLFFGSQPIDFKQGFNFKLFPLGEPVWNTSIVLITVLAGLLNISNTFGALKGSESLFQVEVTEADYRRSLLVTGSGTILASLFGLVPYAPYVSSIGYLKQTEVYERLPFIIGSGLFLLIGLLPSAGAFFASLPLSVGSAVLFVAYLQLFVSSIDYFKQITINSLTVYRVAIPLFTGLVIMILPQTAFNSLPVFLQPFLSNGLLTGIILAIIFESLLDWEKLKTT